ncbi:MAG: hypothetical protein AAGG68_30325 [Bacteroidota bacterium]
MRLNNVSDDVVLDTDTLASTCTVATNTPRIEAAHILKVYPNPVQNVSVVSSAY